MQDEIDPGSVKKFPSPSSLSRYPWIGSTTDDWSTLVTPTLLDPSETSGNLEQHVANKDNTFWINPKYTLYVTIRGMMTEKKPCPQHLAQHPLHLDTHVEHRLWILRNRQCGRFAPLVQPNPVNWNSGTSAGNNQPQQSLAIWTVLHSRSKLNQSPSLIWK